MAMSDPVEQLLREYIAEHRAGGEADPLAFLDRTATAAQRDELLELIDGYLAHAPRRAWGADAFAASQSAVGVADALDRSLLGESGLWPAVLPKLRRRAGVTRARLVEQLAAGLGVAGREEKVGDYYHRMEQGRLTPEGVSDRVLEALGRIVNEPAAALRQAGRSLGPAAESAAGAPQPAFARRASVEEAAEAELSSPAAPPDESWDEVDRLFRGG